jgi:hypothetical protein
MLQNGIYRSGIKKVKDGWEFYLFYFDGDKQFPYLEKTSTLG